MGDDELCYMSATELAQAIRARRVSPVEVTSAILARIEQVNPRVNAYCTVVAEAALVEARKAESAVMRGEGDSPLLGVPISFKDLTPTAGIRTTFGSKIFEDHVPQEDAIVVERVRRAGAVILGKTNTPEFGCKGVTDNRIFGHTRNPWNLDRVAGGSSGGAAAALAAGLGPLAEGSDLAGSIRIPASCCGVVGLKPSLGRVPRYPTLNGWTSLSVHGPMARSVRDVVLLLSVMSGPDDRDPQSLPATGEDFARAAEGGVRGLRVAWSPDLGYAAVDQEVRQITEAAAKSFANLGCVVEEAYPGFEDPEALFLDLTAPYRAAGCGDYLPEWKDQMDPILVNRLLRAEGSSAVAYEKATHRRTALWQIVRRFFEQWDLLLTPTVAVPPFAIGISFPSEIAGRRVQSPIAWIPFTFPFNMTGQPAISVPCGWTAEGLPIGLQIVGRRFADATVLRAAAAFEAACPWAHRRPPI
ncbi:MAG: amidase [Deltaproteobacteria bacterium]|nr:amidase [Deltaproteobacteria bacterium]